MTFQIFATGTPVQVETDDKTYSGLLNQPSDFSRPFTIEGEDGTISFDPRTEELAFILVFDAETTEVSLWLEKCWKDDRLCWGYMRDGSEEPEFIPLDLAA